MASPIHRRSAAHLLLAGAVALASSAFAQTPSQAANKPEGPQPFGLTVGQSTLNDAIAKWTEACAVVQKADHDHPREIRSRTPS